MQANLICVGSKPDASFDLIFLSRDRKAHFGQFPRPESKHEIEKGVRPSGFN